jgi:hypothetical protein
MFQHNNMFLSINQIALFYNVAACSVFMLSQ